MKNIEFKAELRDLELARATCAILKARRVGTLLQTDEYVAVPEGRLKRRTERTGDGADGALGAPGTDGALGRLGALGSDGGLLTAGTEGRPGRVLGRRSRPRLSRMPASVGGSSVPGSM
jgi:hypothetical protein